MHPFLPAHCSDNAIWGRSLNPWSADRTSGGSSGGEGALIAARCSPLGLGSDIGGSIRIPSHFCGVVGFMPTPERTAGSGAVAAHLHGIGWQQIILPSLGPIGRCTEDLLLIMQVGVPMGLG